MASDVDAPWFGVADVHLAASDYPILRGMDLVMRPGEIHALVGMHNSGKSTLCHVLAGLASPDSGRLAALGRWQSFLTPKKAREAGIARVGNPPMVFPGLTVMENLVAGRAGWWLGLRPRRRYQELLGGWLRENGIDFPLARLVGELPRNSRIAVDIVSNLYRRPRLLILDEVMEELGGAWQRQLSALIRRQVGEGMSVLLVTQKIEDALSSADSLTVMRQGKAILTGRTGGMERLTLIRLCYDQLEGMDAEFTDRESFHELVRYTEAMLNDLPTAVFVLDNGLRTRFVNRSGRSLLDAGGNGGGSPFLGEVDARLSQFIEAAGQDGNLLGVSLGGGESPLVDVRVQPISENGVRVGCMVVMEDVTLRESLRRRVALTDKLESIGMLAAGVAHEVNNPLEIIGNYLNFLDEEPLSPGGRKAVDKMGVEVGRIQRIVKNLVAHSGRKSGDSSVDPAALFRELMELLSVHMRPRNITWHCAEPDGPLALDVDPHELRQVFLNLIRNSIDALSDAGELTVLVRLGDEAGTALVSLCDNGSGIGLANPNDVFLPFVTTKKDHATHQGLGLYVVYGIIESYGGSISAANLPEGGCEFRITLPLREK